MTDNAFGRWMAEHDNQPNDDNKHILDVRLKTFLHYQRLTDTQATNRWASQLTQDERQMRDVLTHWFTDLVYRSMRIEDQCHGNEEPVATLERVREIVAGSVALTLIISKGLANGEDIQDDLDAGDLGDFGPPY